MESGLAGMFKIFLIEIGAKNLQQGFAINRIEPGNRSDDGNRAETLDGTFILFVAVTDHDNAFYGHFCTAQRADGEQSVINRSQRSARGNDDGESEMPGEVKHRFGIVDGNENAAGALGNDGPR